MSEQSAIAVAAENGQLMLDAMVCVVLVMLSLQVWGNASRNTNNLHTLPQVPMTYSQFLYSALGLLVIVLRFAAVDWLRSEVKARALSFSVAVALSSWARIGP